MTLSFDDWFDLYRTAILTRWPNPWPDQQLRQAHHDLAAFDPATVEQAITQHVTAGKTFAPNGPELVRTCTELVRHHPPPRALTDGTNYQPPIDDDQLAAFQTDYAKWKAARSTP